MPDPLTETLSLTPIGYMHTNKRVKFQTPHQPSDGVDEENVIELLPGRSFEQALQDLEGFDRIWLVWWFHRNSTWRPRVLPPRGNAQRRGVFATRSPHRPNPIGITSVPLVRIEGRKLFVGNSDLVDGTPILDIKPYLPSVDAFPSAKQGWLDDVEAELALPPRYTVIPSLHASEQIEWLRTNWQIDIFTRAVSLLERDPTPHRTRRISRRENGEFRMGCGAWRIFFTVSGDVVTVLRVTPGYPSPLLFGEGYTRVPDRDAQISFLAQFPS